MSQASASSSATRRILVTSALPYANGPIHLGHLVEYIQTDIWVRYQKLNGREVYYFCADDTHGTPIMIAARKAGISPEELVERTHAQHLRDLSGFLVEFDNYYTTHSPENRELASHIYNSAKEQGRIARRNVEQLYCETDQMFLPDRFVKGSCPVCKSGDQYGDSCEVCGSTYQPKDLGEPACAICGAPPVPRESEHLFFQLPAFQDFLKEWLDGAGRVDPGIRKKMDEWLESGLKEWDISRDGPYFGFAIPGEENKYFYVWLDAPVGYMASAREYFARSGVPERFDEFWRDASESTEVYHFIGKDITYFHTLFWPALLKAGGFRTPSAVFVHGFLTLNGEKMSKSRGTLVRAENYLKHLHPEALRYFYASRLGAGLDDLDLSLSEFVQKYNADVVGALANIFSRLGAGIAKKLDHKLSEALTPAGEELRAESLASARAAAPLYEKREYARAVREIMAAADRINRFINDAAPWELIKTDPEAARGVVTDGLTAGRILAGAIKPILPQFVAGAEAFLNIEPISFLNLEWTFPTGHVVQPYMHLASRLEEKQCNAMLEDERKSIAAEQKPEKAKQAKSAKQAEDDSGAESIISIDDLTKVELRAGRILSAEPVEGADRLLRIQLDLGEERPRNVIAGIRLAYQPEALQGLTVLAVANLQPRKMKFGVSEAMLLAAGEGAELTLFVPHRSAKPGERLR